MDKYSDKLKKILVCTGFSQEKLADLVGVSFVSLNAWVNEKSEPREKAKEKIDEIFAEYLGAEELDKDVLKKVKIDAEKQKYSIKKLLSDRELLDKIAVNLAYHTNATEGSTMTEGDVEAVILDNKVLKNRTANEQREAINHNTALFFLLDELNEKKDKFEFSENLIKNVHLRLMNGMITDAGMFRNHQVRIRGGKVALVNYMRVPDLVERWCAKANSETLDKVQTLAELHAEFERIHPFSDGNGRTGRLLLFIMALKMKIVPPILKREKKSAYYKYLELAQTRGETDFLEKYIAEAIIDTAEIIEDSEV